MSRKSKTIQGITKEELSSLAGVCGRGLIIPIECPEDLVRHLNLVRSHERRARIGNVLDLFQSFKAPRNYIKARSNGERQVVLQRTLRLKTREEDIFAPMLRYRVTPAVLPDGSSICYLMDIPERDAGAEYQETTFVVSIFHLTLRNVVDRLRICECGKFLYARRFDRIYCSDNCRVRSHQASEEFKVKRREYQRSWYRLKTSGKVK
jgi:hypothetical protein